ncbi:Ig-like domain-containing protein [Streptomyces sp. DSM 41524]|uniref:Ig-like domain-containing protein n=1 Tax=Streptomyces asiaticus subsp. ignotus TaxID=3098222 RepID=A0ABU7Q893_9ACTN|nr:Ig-like domain-containing protein [Streptomyces sp. DSM 41524]
MPATTTTLSFTPLSPECGQTVVLTATVAPTPPDGETVQFIISADGPTLTGTLNGGRATATLSTLSVGSHTAAAAYPGDGLFDPSSSAFVPITVNPAATTTTVTSINPASPVCGQTVQLCAHVAASSPSPCLPTGQVTFAVSGGPTLLGNLDANGNVCVSTTGIAPGTHTVTVTYAGNGSVQGSSVNGSITVAKSNSSTLLISSPNSSTFGQNVTFTATVVAVAPGGGVPTGNVTFTISGGPILMGTLNGVGQATASTSALTAGPHTVTATYNGDGCFNPSTSAVLTQQVNPKATTLTAVPATIRMRTNGTFVIPTLSAHTHGDGDERCRRRPDHHLQRQLRTGPVAPGQRGHGRHRNGDPHQCCSRRAPPQLARAGPPPRSRSAAVQRRAGRCPGAVPWRPVRRLSPPGCCAGRRARRCRCRGRARRLRRR